jgi:hypothetical protein
MEELMHTMLWPASREGLVATTPAQGYCGLKFTWTLKVVLLSGTMGVFGSLAAYAGTSGLPLGSNGEKTTPAGSVAAQAVEACLPWDIPCLLLRPVGTVSGGPAAGAGDRGQEGNDGVGEGTGGGGTGGGGTGGGGTGGGGTGGGGGGDPQGASGDDTDNDNGVGNGHTGTATGQAGIAESDPSNPGEGRGFGRNGGGNAGGGDPPDHE